MKCRICGKDCKILANHLRVHDVTPRGYYDRYLKSDGEGVCPVCGKPTTFRGFSVGYDRCCSKQCAAKNPERQDKIRSTNLERYGVTNAYQKPEVVAKSRANSHTPEAMAKQFATKKAKYGVTSFWQIPEIHAKAIANGHTEEVEANRRAAFRKRLDDFEMEHDCTGTKKLVLEYGQGWLSHKTELGLTVLTYGNKSFVLNSDIPKIAAYVAEDHYVPHKSQYEDEIAEYVESIHEGEVVRNERGLIGRKELDVYVPDANLAIEFNGDYWHSEIYMGKTSHLEKTEACEDIGVRLIHIAQLEWLYKTDICKSMVSAALGVYDERIYARDCDVREVSPKDAETFLRTNHIQGPINASYRLGLYHDGELAQIICIGKSRFKSGERELLRMCAKLNTQVVGGFGKLLAHQPYDALVSYVDRAKFDGRGYLACGWVLVGETAPSYVYWKNNVERYVSRYEAQKHKLPKLLGDGFDPNLTEAENMLNAGYLRIYDCGNLKMEWRR